MPDRNSMEPEASLIRMLECIHNHKHYPNPIGAEAEGELRQDLGMRGYIEMVAAAKGDQDAKWIVTDMGKHVLEAFLPKPAPSESEVLKVFEDQLDKARERALKDEERRGMERAEAKDPKKFPPGETAVPNWDELNARVMRLEAALEHVRQYLPTFLRPYIDAELEGK